VSTPATTTRTFTFTGEGGRLETVFRAARARGKKLLVTYLCIGDPNEEESLALAKACVDAGADVLELGTPFSDPTADGPAIARASERAIAKGGGLEMSLRVAAQLRASYTDLPLVLFGYFNPLFTRGEDRAPADARTAGVDAMLVVDLPVGEGAAFRAVARVANVRVVPLVAPTSTAAHVDAIRANAADAGFVYYVSVAGVTGARAAPLEEAARRAAEIREKTSLPVVIGFGIDSPEKAKIAASGADGVVVGTAIVRAIEDATTPNDRIARVRALVSSLRAALDAS
jgi:tryptophan synthase alpha chain